MPSSDGGSNTSGPPPGLGGGGPPMGGRPGGGNGIAGSIPWVCNHAIVASSAVPNAARPRLARLPNSTPAPQIGIKNSAGHGPCAPVRSATATVKLVQTPSSTNSDSVGRPSRTSNSSKPASASAASRTSSSPARDGGPSAPGSRPNGGGGGGRS